MNPHLEFTDDKYGNMMVFWEYKPRKEHYEWTVYMKMPVHLYDFVRYQSAGKHTTYYGDGRVEEGYHEEETGTEVYQSTQNWRLDFERSEVPTKETAVQAVDSELQDCIENNDGVVYFEKIVGIK